MAHRVYARNSRDDPASQADQRQSLAEEELASSNDWFIRLRWVAGAGVITAALVANALTYLGIPPDPLFWIGGCILLYNLAFFLISRRVRHLSEVQARSLAYRRLTLTQMTLDWLALGYLGDPLEWGGRFYTK